MTNHQPLKVVALDPTLAEHMIATKEAIPIGVIPHDSITKADLTYMFHTLWTIHGTRDPAYNKQDWKTLRNAMMKAGLIL